MAAAAKAAAAKEAADSYRKNLLESIYTHIMECAADGKSECTFSLDEDYSIQDVSMIVDNLKKNGYGVNPQDSNIQVWWYHIWRTNTRKAKWRYWAN